jgi:hypothetical protein
VGKLERQQNIPLSLANLKEVLMVRLVLKKVDLSSTDGDHSSLGCGGDERVRVTLKTMASAQLISAEQLWQHAET